MQWDDKMKTGLGDGGSVEENGCFKRLKLPEKCTMTVQMTDIPRIL